MKRYWKAGALLVLLPVWAIAPLFGAGPKPPAKPPARPAVQGRGRAPAAPKAPKKINDPGASIAQRLFQMTPEERERALEKFPPARQAQIRQRLAKLDSLPPQRQQRLAQQFRLFANLPPDKQLLVRRQIQAYNQLPDDRKQIVGPELQKLRRMPEDKREAHLESEEFRNKFTPAEQKIIEDVSRNLPLR
ncbi:MAG TPA: DUF3106 domain-containing protein [Bryobacteraceae bacterium]|jgi:hypothetical protein